MRLAQGGLVLLAVVALVGCGKSEQTKQRDAVNAYFTQVNQAEAPLVAQNKRINAAFAKFKITGNSAAEVSELQQAQRTIAATLRKVRAIQPPAAAKAMHRDIVGLVVLQEAVANDLVRTTSYVPQLSKALVPLQQADQTLEHDLAELDQSRAPHGKTVKPPMLATALAGFAAAFNRFGVSLQAVADRLDRLDPPLELRAELTAQRAAVRRSVALTSSIVAALGRKDIDAANADIHTLFVLAPQTSVIGTPSAETAALKAYDARLETIARREIAINSERTRLVRSVG